MTPRANRQPDADPRKRVCITINEQVLRAGQAYAASRARSFSNLVEWLVRQAVDPPKQ